MTLYEGENATIQFLNYSQSYDSLIGVFKDSIKKIELPVVLRKEYDFDLCYGDGREMLQTISLQNYFFKLLVVPTKEPPYASWVTGIKIYSIKTGAVYQEIKADFPLHRGINSIETDDYNFDGIRDFSVFEFQCAGTNTTRRYLLFNPKTKKFFDSGFEGSSLIFDSTSRTITEYNECAGVYSSGTHILKHNKMVLIKEHRDTVK